jgi:hypothetical protein
MQKFIRQIALTTVVATAVAVPMIASATHSWGNYHWARTANPFTLKVTDSVTAEWQYALEESLSRWSQSTVLDNTVTAGDEGDRTRKRCPAIAGQLRVCNAAYGQQGWLGMASINIDAQGHITRGIAQMNDSYDWYFVQHPGEDNHVMCQELGHLYGLGHTSEDGTTQNTCMDYSVSLASQWPNQHDYDQLVLIYGHLDNYNSYDAGSGGGTGGDCKGRKCLGADAPSGGVPAGAVRVHFQAGRNGQLGHADYVLPDGRGGIWLLHVTLLPEEHQDH